MSWASKLWKKIKKWTGIGIVEDFLTKSLKALFNGDIFQLDFLKNYVRDIFSWFGITDEQMFIGYVSVSKVFDDDYLKTMKTKQAIKFNKEDISGLEYYLGFTNTGNNQYSLYYNQGKQYTKLLSEDNKPSIILSTKVVPNSTVEDILKNLYGNDITLTDVFYGALDYKFYARKYIADRTNFNFTTDTAIINNTAYELKDDNIIINDDTEQLDITLTPLEGYIIETTTVVTTYDSVSTTVNGITTVTVTKYTDTFVATNVYNNSDTMIDSDSIVTSKSEIVATAESNSTTSSEIKYDYTPSASNITYSASLDFDGGDTYITAEYVKNGEREIWLYNTSDNIYPQLNNTVNLYENDTPLPVTVLRSDFHDITEYKTINSEFVNETVYKGSKKLLAKCELDLDDFIDKIHGISDDDDTSEEKDLSKIRSMFFILGIDILNIKSEPVSKVLFTKFYELYKDVILGYASDDNTSTNVSSAIAKTINASSANQSVNNYSTITFRQKPFTCCINYYPTSIEVKEGQLDDPLNTGKKLEIGKCKHEFITTDYTVKKYIHKKVTYVYKTLSYNNQQYLVGANVQSYVETVKKDSSTDEIVNSIIGDITTKYISYYDEEGYYTANFPKEGTTVTPYMVETIDSSSDNTESGSGGTVTYTEYESTSSSSVLKLYKQKNGFEYIVITLTAPSFFYLVNEEQGKSGIITVNLNATNATYAVSDDEEDENRQNIHAIIPLVYDDLKDMNLMEKTNLFGDVTYLVMFGEEWKTIKWYQTKAFKRWFRIIQVIITVIVFIFTWYTGPGASGGVWAVLESVFETVVICVAASLALKLIAKYVHNAFLNAILSAVVMVISAYAGGGFDLDNMFMTGVELVTIGTEALTAGLNADLSSKMKDLQSNIDSFETQYNERMESFDEVSSSMDDSWDASDMVSLTTSNTSNNSSYSLYSGFQSLRSTSEGLSSLSLPSLDEHIYLALNGVYLYDLMYNLPERNISKIESSIQINYEYDLFNDNND